MSIVLKWPQDCASQGLVCSLMFQTVTLGMSHIADTANESPQ